MKVYVFITEAEYSRWVKIFSTKDKLVQYIKQECDINAGNFMVNSLVAYDEVTFNAQDLEEHGYRAYCDDLVWSVEHIEIDN